MDEKRRERAGLRTPWTGGIKKTGGMKEESLKSAKSLKLVEGWVFLTEVHANLHISCKEVEAQQSG